uniref:Uncharacterized protein n=1 Tax=Caenorhabditis japonica TaxID=281687 RepID=A0A8R1DM49_CAEJA
MTGNEDYARIIPFNNDENELVIYQEMLTDVGGVIWDSALMTIHYFFKNPTLFEGKKVNEYYYGVIDEIANNSSKIRRMLRSTLNFGKKWQTYSRAFLENLRPMYRFKDFSEKSDILA